ncbi:hypothetical protein WA026_006835 [Henosepilachna vigintioctopunctata]|uniref:Uncharacterized protein n=1 Tax=Henosepilachna vigintioctopunctata TaxID=420089 RepID=A0AAW1UI62_9CUCU
MQTLDNSLFGLVKTDYSQVYNNFMSLNPVQTISVNFVQSLFEECNQGIRGSRYFSSQFTDIHGGTLKTISDNNISLAIVTDNGESGIINSAPDNLNCL